MNEGPAGIYEYKKTLEPMARCQPKRLADSALDATTTMPYWASFGCWTGATLYHPRFADRPGEGGDAKRRKASR